MRFGKWMDNKIPPKGFLDRQKQKVREPCSEDKKRKISLAQKGKPRAKHVIDILKSYSDAKRGISVVWTDDLVEIVRNNLNMTNKELSAMCGLSVISIKNMMVGKGIKRSDELSESVRVKVLKGRVLSDDVKRKISIGMSGKKRSDEHCKNLSKVLTGRKLSEAPADKMNDFVGMGNELIFVDNPNCIDLSRRWVRW